MCIGHVRLARAGRDGAHEVTSCDVASEPAAEVLIGYVYIDRLPLARDELITDPRLTGALQSAMMAPSRVRSMRLL
jgi:hypothetical protein